MRQPPAHSPLPWGALRASAGALLRRTEDPRPALRQLLAREFAAEDVTLFASGTQALQVALTGSAPTVALPAFTCFDVATAAVGANLRVALYDLDPVTLTPDLDSLRGALTDGAGIVVIAPLFGLPPDWQAVQSLVDAAGAVLVEDAAQGSGARWQGRPVGSLGAMSVLSFGRGKGWTGGGGGALLTRTPNDPPRSMSRSGDDRVADLRAVSVAAAQWTFGRPALYGIPAALPWLGLGETRYRDPVRPRSMSRVSASLLLHGAAAAQQEAEERKRRAARLLEMLPSRPGIEPVMPSRLGRGESGYLRLPLRVKGGLDGLAHPDAAVRLGAARSYPKSIGELPAVRARLVGRRQSWLGAEELARELITLPTHSLLAAGDLERLVRAVTG